MDKIRKNKILFLLVVLGFLISQGCNRNLITQEFGSYPMALYWNGGLYQPSADKPIDKSVIQKEIGKITKHVNPMPKDNGEINSTNNFSVGDKLFSLSNVEITEAIAAQKGGTFYRLDRMRSSLGIVWEGRVYDFTGNFDNEDEKRNIDRQIGMIKRSGINSKDATSGDITILGEEADSSYFPVGSKVYTLKKVGLDSSIAVTDKNVRYQKAVYIKKLN